MATVGLGITVGGHTLRAVQVRRKGSSFQVVRAVSMRLDEAMRADAGRILAAKGIKGGPATVGLTGKDVIIRYNQVPPVPEWRLKNLMKFEVMEVSGQSGGEVAADYRRLNLPDPDGTRGEDTVLVSLARGAYLNPLIASVEGAGIAVSGGCPNSVGLFNAFAVNATYREDETCLLVYVGAQATDLALERGGELIFARNASPGGGAFTDAVATAFSTTPAKAETLKATKGDVTPRGQAKYPDSTSEKVANAMVAAAGQIAALIQSTLMIGRAQTKLPDLKVDRVLLAGGGASLKGLDLYLKDRMGVPVQRFDPFGGLDTSALPEDERQALSAAPHEYAVALGLAQNAFTPAEGGPQFHLEVVPERVRSRREFATRGVLSVAAGVVALSALGILWWARTDAAASVTTQAAALKKEGQRWQQSDTEMKEQMKRLQEAREKHRRLSELAGPGVLFADTNAVLLKNLKDHPEVWLEEETLDVLDPLGSYLLVHPLPGGNGGFQAREHARSERRARVKVVGRVSSVAGPEKVFNDFVAGCKANDKGLVVETRKTFSSREARFELSFLPGVEVRPKAEPQSSSNVIPWVVRRPAVAADGGSVSGVDSQGLPVTIRREDADPASWKAMQDALPSAPAAGGNG